MEFQPFILTILWVFAAWCVALTIAFIRLHIRERKLFKEHQILSDLYSETVHGMMRKIRKIEERQQNRRIFKKNKPIKIQIEESTTPKQFS